MNSFTTITKVVNEFMLLTAPNGRKYITSVKVFELVPPAVDTELGKGTAEEGETENRGIPPGEVAQAALSAIADNEHEIFVGEANDLAMRARTNPEQAFQNINRW